MQDFHEVSFPLEIAYDSIVGPQFSTKITTSKSGYEQRNINWDNARLHFNVATGINTQERLDKLLSFFRARKGMAYGFRIRDFSDYKAQKQIIGIGDSKTTKFQLTKEYPDEIAVTRRIINKPVKNTIVVYQNSRPDSSVLVDYTNGEIKFPTPPAANVVISADFEFDVPVRFNNDYLPAKIESYLAYSANNISLIEVKL